MRTGDTLWRPVPYTGLHARLPYRAALIHTNGGGTDRGSLYGWWTSVAQGGQHIGAHYQVPWSGRTEQYVDTSLVVYHAYSASEWAFGIEVEDDDHSQTPMNDNQLTAIVDILRQHAVPGRLLTSPAAAHGVGYHQLFPAWNQDGHDCPGTVRSRQVRDLIIPALNQEADMALSDSDIHKIATTVLTAMLGNSGPTVAVALQSGYHNTVNAVAELAALKQALAQSGVVVDYTQVQAAAERAVKTVLAHAATP